MAKPKERDEQEALKLDECFKETLERIRPYILSLSAAEESQLCRVWLEKLNRAVGQRPLRNRYLLELCRHLKAGHVDGIFSKPPQNGPLRPLPRICNYTLRVSSSLSEITDSSSAVPYECSRRSSNRRRNKTVSLSRSSDSASSINGNYAIAGSPAARQCEKARAGRNQTAACRRRTEGLVVAVNELQIQNGRLKRDLSYSRENCECKEKSKDLRSSIDKLTAEITTLKTKLVEVQSMKDLLERNHREIVQQYKSTMTEQANEINELNIRLRDAQSRNVELDEKLAAAGCRLEEIMREKEEEAAKMEQNCKEQIEDARRNYESLLSEKYSELQLKDEIISHKATELNESNKKSNEEIASLLNKIQELEDKFEVKNEDEGNLQSFLKEQYSTMKEEFAKMRMDMEIATQMQNEKLVDKISTLKRVVMKLEKSKEKMNFECERKISDILKRKDMEIKSLHIQLQEQRTELATTLNSEKQCELDSVVALLEKRYKGLLAAADASAGNQRQNFLRKITNLENQVMILRKSMDEHSEYV